MPSVLTKKKVAVRFAAATPKPFETIPKEKDPAANVLNVDNSNISLYFREISMFRLLTIEEETALARKKQRGRTKRDREEAAAILTQCNLRLVVKIARGYEGCGLPLLDLINEGNIGLMKAVELFDPSKGAKLSTYSSWWIKQCIKRALCNQSKTIRLPVHVVDKVFKMRKVSRKLADLFDREPTAEELSDEMGIPARKLEKFLQASQGTVSLDFRLGTCQEDFSTVEEVTRDENAENASEAHELNDAIHKLRHLCSELEPREFDILRYRFGLDGREEMTLKRLGKKFCVTRERIRQIQNNALKKLYEAFSELEEETASSVLKGMMAVSKN